MSELPSWVSKREMLTTHKNYIFYSKDWSTFSIAGGERLPLFSSGGISNLEHAQVCLVFKFLHVRNFYWSLNVWKINTCDSILAIDFIVIDSKYFIRSLDPRSSIEECKVSTYKKHSFVPLNSLGEAPLNNKWKWHLSDVWQYKTTMTPIPDRLKTFDSPRSVTLKRHTTPVFFHF